MAKEKKSTINVQGTAIAIVAQQEEDYISLTDIARHRNAEHSDDLIRNCFAIGIQLSFLGYGNSLITRILIPSNSTGLECKPD